MGANKLEAYEIEVVNRSDIQEADYNPRVIKENSRKKLVKFLKTNGLWSPLIVNKRNMTLVSGHQRLSCMDTVLRKNDYDITVSMIDVDEKTEISGNLFLNNVSAQGEYDPFLLEGIAELCPEIDFVIDAGFDQSDIDVLLGVAEGKETVSEEIDEATKDKFREIRKKDRESKKEANAESGDYSLNDIDYTVSFVFPNNREKTKFMENIRKPLNEKFLKSTILFDIYEHKFNL